MRLKGDPEPAIPSGGDTKQASLASLRIFSYPGAEEAAAGVAEKLNSIFEREFGTPLLFLFDGDADLAPLASVRAELLGSHMTVMASDERESADPKQNHFARLMETSFFRNAKERNCSLVDTRLHPGETFAELGARMNEVLRSFRAANPGGKVILLQTVSSDGGTCGIPPIPRDPERFAFFFEHKDVWATGYGEAGVPYSRSAITASFIRSQVSESVAYVVGAGAQGSIAALTSKKERPLAEFPAWIIRYISAVSLFTDQRVG